MSYVQKVCMHERAGRFRFEGIWIEMIDVIGMGCGGMDERYLVSRTLYVVSIMSFIYKIHLRYLKPSRSTPVGYRFLNHSACCF